MPQIVTGRLRPSRARSGEVTITQTAPSLIRLQSSTEFAGRFAGVGGFMNIAQNAKRMIFCSSFRACELAVAMDGRFAVQRGIPADSGLRRYAIHLRIVVNALADGQ
jgi:hypothetical protein